MTTFGTFTRIWIVLGLFLLWPAGVSAERLSVKASIANIRGGPGTGHEVLWNVQRYYPISVINRAGSWIYFKDFEGDRGWIHDSLTSRIPSVITINEKNNIRSGPGTGYEIRFTVDVGIPFKVLDRKGAWIRVEHADGDKGWIHQSIVW